MRLAQLLTDAPGLRLRDESVSLEAMLQRGRSPNETVPVVLTTHDTEEAAMNRALRHDEEIAAMVRCPVGTVKWRISEARRRVRAELVKLGYGQRR